MYVRASRSLGTMTRIGTAIRGGVLVICSISCVCTSRSRRKRPGSGSGKGRSCEGWRETAVGERWPVGGRPDLSPLVASTPSRLTWCSVLLERVGSGGGGPGDGEDAPVGLGPRRTRPHRLGAKQVYRAP